MSDVPFAHSRKSSFAEAVAQADAVAKTAWKWLSPKRAISLTVLVVLALSIHSGHIEARAPLAFSSNSSLMDTLLFKSRLSHQHEIQFGAHRWTKAAASEEDGEEVGGSSFGRYLVVAHLDEQETKAQMHLYDLAMLARSLKRTLVLPGLSGARYGFCEEYRDFDFFYEPDAVSRFGVETISRVDFLESIALAPQVPTAQILHLTLNNSDPNPGQLRVSSLDPYEDDVLTRRMPCLSPDLFDFAARPPLRVTKSKGFLSPKNKMTRWASQVVEDLLGLERVVGETDVLLVEQTYREHWINEDVANNFAPSLARPALPFDWLAYSNTWTDYAAALADSLGPYVAVHWRMESRPPSRITPCGTSLIDKLLYLTEKHPEVKLVYLLMDYPIDALTVEEDGTVTRARRVKANSSTFRNITMEYHNAVRDFVVEMRARLPGMTWTTLRQSQFNVPFPPVIEGEVTAATFAKSLVSKTREEEELWDPLGLDLVDRSLLAIVDKEVAARASLFVSSSYEQGACGRVSSFTRHILALREKAVAAGEGGLLNVGTTWSVGRNNRH